MNDAMKIEKIQDYMKKSDVELSSNVIYAQIDAKAWKYALFSGFAALAIQHFLVVFEKDDILLIGVTKMGDFANKDTNISRATINNIQYKKGLLQGTLTIQLKDNELQFKIPKVIAVAKWHKENMEHLLRRDFK